MPGLIVETNTGMYSLLAHSMDIIFFMLFSKVSPQCAVYTKIMHNASVSWIGAIGTKFFCVDNQVSKMHTHAVCCLRSIVIVVKNKAMCVAQFLSQPPK